MDVLISGLGIAGPTLAWWLRRHGWTPVVVELAGAPRDGGYFIDFWGKGYDIAEAMGLLPEILDTGYRVREVRFVGGDGRRTGGFSADVFRRATQDRYTSLPRGALSAILRRAIEGDVEIRYGDHVTAIDRSDGRAQVTFAHGGTRTFDLVVGADGVHSGVRAIAFGSQPRFEKYLGYGVAAFVLPDYAPRDPDIYVMHSEPGLQVARFAERDGSTLVLLVFAEDGAFEVPEDRDARKAMLRARFAGVGWEASDMLAAMQGCDEVYVDRVSQICMPEWVNGPVALLGDAAAAPSLLAGQGSALAMLSAYVLAGELAAAGDVARGCAAYEARVRPFIEAKQRAARGFAHSFAPRTSLGILARDWIGSAMDLPFVADWTMGPLMRDRIELPEYRGLSGVQG